MEHTVSLKLNRVFHRLYGRRKSTVNPCLAVYYRENNLGYSRLGLTVGAKLGKAVVCNRTRCRIKEAYHIHEGAFLPGYDIAVVVRVRAAYSRYRELEHSFLSLADKLGLLRKEGVWLKRLLLTLIRGYRTYTSPSRLPCCRSIPTCSAYALEAAEKYGAWEGGFSALRRILKCQPFHKQVSIEYDPVP